MFTTLVYVSYSTSFYVFTLSSRLYRKELMKIIWFWKPEQNESDIIKEKTFLSRSTLKD
jgi:hypothetical protein